MRYLSSISLALIVHVLLSIGILMALACTATPGGSELLREHLATAKSYCDLGEYHNAKEYYDQAIKLDPNNPEIYLMRGAVLVQLGQFNLASKDVDKACELDRALACGSERMRLQLIGWSPEEGTAPIRCLP